MEKTLREFEHDGSKFTINASLKDDLWSIYAICDGDKIGAVSTVSNDVKAQAEQKEVYLLEIIADEFEKLIRSIRDLTVEAIR